MTSTIRCAIAAAALAMATPAFAVSLNPEGLGQALVFPYYTANSAGGNSFNTYISIVNETTDAKALRVRFREGRNGREALAFNLYLAPRDVWTGAVVPFNTGTRLVSTDISCTDPPLQAQTGAPPFMPFTTAGFTGASDDGAGAEPQRTREGFVEVLEMAVLTGTAAAAVTHGSAGPPINCGAMIGNASPPVARPSGGLSGTLTLINVASGLDFTVNAEALADLASRPYFRPPNDAYPDFNAAEIDAVSEVIASGATYRSRWSRPVDAVSATLMRTAWSGEYVLDAGTQSLTDFVLTFPTRHFYVNASASQPPFPPGPAWSFDCTGQNLLARVGVTFHNREARVATTNGSDFPEQLPGVGPSICASAAVVSVRNGAAHMPASRQTSSVLGSETVGFGQGALTVTSTFNNGWVRFAAPATASLTSEATSTRWTATGSLITGAHQLMGQPMLGFSVRTLRNGTLTCGAATCQGNYGGAFPLKYLRSIATPTP